MIVSKLSSECHEEDSKGCHGRGKESVSTLGYGVARRLRVLERGGGRWDLSEGRRGVILVDTGAHNRVVRLVEVVRVAADLCQLECCVASVDLVVGVIGVADEIVVVARANP